MLLERRWMSSLFFSTSSNVGPTWCSRRSVPSIYIQWNQRWWKQVEAKWTKKLKYSSVDYHLEEKLAMFISLPFACIPFSNVVKTLGVTLDAELSLEQHISTVVRSCFFHTRSLSKVCPYITCKPACIAVWFCRILTNGFLSGLPQKQVKRLQVVQNAAARIVLKCKQNNKNRSCHSHS